MTANKDPKIGGILLAAGGSSRLGQPKQLLNFKGKTLVRRSAETLVDSGCGSIVVVLGAETERSTAELDNLDVTICVNEIWQAGMSTSIVAGLNSLLSSEPDLDAVVITLCDQPHVVSADIDRLIETYQDSRPAIVAARYGDTTGVPSLFSKELFYKLLALRGDRGARQLIQDHGGITYTIAIERAAIDIDTVEDAGRLLNL